MVLKWTVPSLGKDFIKGMVIKLGLKDKADFKKYRKIEHNRLKAMREKSKKEEESEFPLGRIANNAR